MDFKILNNSERSWEIILRIWYTPKQNKIQKINTLASGFS